MARAGVVGCGERLFSLGGKAGVSARQSSSDANGRRRVGLPTGETGEIQADFYLQEGEELVFMRSGAEILRIMATGVTSISKAR
ncbi:MAG: hypothetical protein ABI828_06445 [Actinomycetota bacterium]